MATKAKRKSKVKAKTKVGPIPKRYHTVTPTLVVRNAPEAIEFYKKAFGAKEKYRMWGDRNGQLMDPSGHLWSIATHQRDMSAKEMQKAQEEWLAQQQQQ
jgi:hypothetical protein